MGCFLRIAGKANDEEGNIFSYSVDAYRMCPGIRKGRGTFIYDYYSGW